MLDENKYAATPDNFGDSCTLTFTGKSYTGVALGEVITLPLSEGAQNRLIVENTNLIAPIAAKYRGAKGIPFEDLTSEGMLGLVKAARAWEQRGVFGAFAVDHIRGAILMLIRDWEDPISFEDAGLINRETGEEIYYEWDCWPNATPYLTWETLAATPEDLVIAFEEMANRREALSSAVLSLGKRDRQILQARFFRDPPQTLDSIARDHKISYSRTVELLDLALKRVKKIVDAIEVNRAIAVAQ